MRDFLDERGRQPLRGSRDYVESRADELRVTATSIRIDAKPDEVLPYLTDAALMVRWMGDWVDLDPEPGVDLRRGLRGRPGAGRLPRWSRPAGSCSPGAPLERVPPGSFTVEITPEPDGDGTLLQLVHRDLPPEEAPRHGEGWSTTCRFWPGRSGFGDGAPLGALRPAWRTWPARRWCSGAPELPFAPLRAGEGGHVDVEVEWSCPMSMTMRIAHQQAIGPAVDRLGGDVADAEPVCAAREAAVGHQRSPHPARRPSWPRSSPAHAGAALRALVADDHHVARLDRPARIASIAPSSPSNTRAGPSNVSESMPATFTTAPFGASDP